MREIEPKYPRPYPTDARGFPVPVEEVRIPYIESPRYNNHHLNYYARMFARTAIAQTFRDMKSYQEIMPSLSHELLHKRWAGIALPDERDMLERIEEGCENGEQLKIYSKEDHGYLYTDISDELVFSLTSLYNQANNQRRIVA